LIGAVPSTPKSFIVTGIQISFTFTQISVGTGSMLRVCDEVGDSPDEDASSDAIGERDGGGTIEGDCQGDNGGVDEGAAGRGRNSDGK
jgi:hypothetical protein